MMRVLNFLELMGAIVCGFFGAALFKSFYRDFSLIDFSYQNILASLLGGAFFTALGLYIGFYAFKRMKGS